MEETQETGGESTVVETAGESTGQSEAPTQTTGNGTEQVGESFYDYESIRGKPELEAQYKEMQRAFGEKNETVKAGADKIRQFDQFMANPVETMRQLATQYGYQMVQGQPAEDGQPKTFENWDDVMAHAESRVMEKLQPMFGEMQNMKQQNVEQALDNSHPDWRTYEDAMMATLRDHPTLVGNPDMLYRMSVPPSVLEARANKAALQRIQGTTESGKVQGQSTTTRQATAPTAAKNFDDAVKIARATLAKRGMKPPQE